MEFGAQIAFALVLGVPIACITWTVTQEELFHEMRDFLARYQVRHRHSWWRRKLAAMPACPYCLSHYVAGLLALFLQFKMLVPDWRGYVVSLLTLVLIANVYLTLYHILRVGLRWTRSLADLAQTAAFVVPAQAAPSPEAAASVKLAGNVPSPRRTAREMTFDRHFEAGGNHVARFTPTGLRVDARIKGKVASWEERIGAAPGP